MQTISICSWFWDICRLCLRPTSSCCIFFCYFYNLLHTMGLVGFIFEISVLGCLAAGIHRNTCIDGIRHVLTVSCEGRMFKSRKGRFAKWKFRIYTYLCEREKDRWSIQSNWIHHDVCSSQHSSSHLHGITPHDWHDPLRIRNRLSSVDNWTPSPQALPLRTESQNFWVCCSASCITSFLGSHTYNNLSPCNLEYTSSCIFVHSISMLW